MESIIRNAIKKYGLNSISPSPGGKIYTNLDGQLKNDKGSSIVKNEELMIRNWHSLDKETSIYAIFYLIEKTEGGFFTSTRTLHYSCCVLAEGISFFCKIETDGWDKEEDCIFFMPWDELERVSYVSNIIEDNKKYESSLVLKNDPTFKYFSTKTIIEGFSFYPLDGLNYSNIPSTYFGIPFLDIYLLLTESKSIFDINSFKKIENISSFFNEIIEKSRYTSNQTQENFDILLANVKNLMDLEQYEKAFYLFEEVNLDIKKIDLVDLSLALFYIIKIALKTNRVDLALELFDYFNDSKRIMNTLRLDKINVKIPKLVKVLKVISNYLLSEAEINQYFGKTYETALAYDKLKEIKSKSGDNSQNYTFDKQKKIHYDNYITNFNELDYADRRLIVVSNTDKLFKSAHLTLVNKSNLPQVQFPITHPKINHTYVCHPFKKNSYLPIDNYDYELLNDRINEYCYLLQCLGATSISIENVKGEDNETHTHSNRNMEGEYGNRIISAKGSYEIDKTNDSSQKHHLKIGRHQTFNPTKKPFVPDDLIWLPNEFGWQRLIKQRLEGDLLNHNEYLSSRENQILSNSEIMDINAELNILLMSIKGGVKSKKESKIQNNKESEWKVSVTFKPIDEFGNETFIEVIEETPIKVIEEGQDTILENENLYIEEVRFMLEDDGIIDEKERMMLDRFRKRFGISDKRARDLEEMIISENDLSKEEKEYLNEFKAFITDGKVTDRERRMLNRMANLLGISEERAIELERRS